MNTCSRDDNFVADRGALCEIMTAMLFVGKHFDADTQAFDARRERRLMSGDALHSSSEVRYDHR